VSYMFYKVLHVVAVLFLFTALGGLAVGAAAGSDRLRRAAMAVHGVSLAVVLVAGFGLLARLGFMSQIPLWAWLKVVIWLLLALAVVALRRRPQWAAGLWVAMPVLGGLGAWLAITKPF